MKSHNQICQIASRAAVQFHNLLQTLISHLLTQSATIFVAQSTQFCTVKLAIPSFRVWVRETITAKNPRGRFGPVNGPVSGRSPPTSCVQDVSPRPVYSPWIRACIRAQYPRKVASKDNCTRLKHVTEQNHYYNIEKTPTKFCSTCPRQKVWQTRIKLYKHCHCCDT